MKYYIDDNPSLKEKRTPDDVFQTFNEAEQKAYRSMHTSELLYLTKECLIQKYVTYLRRGRDNKAIGSDFPILVVQGTSLQLERYRLTFLLSLIDYQGTKDYYPNDFALGHEALEEIKNYTGVAFVRIRRGSATSEGLDIHRSELIKSALMNRRDYFNPTIVLAEEAIAGALNMGDGATVKVIELDTKKLRGSYDGKSVQEFKKTIASRKTTPKQIVQPTNNANTNNNYNTNNNTSNRYGHALPSDKVEALKNQNQKQYS